MFFHDLKYELLTILRTKAVIFWLILFPIALGSFFKIAFDGIYEKTTKFSAVPTAVVNESKDANFDNIIRQVSEGSDPLLEVTYADTAEEAEKLLRDGDVQGIITKTDKLTLTVAGSGINQTILKAFTDSYTLQEGIITEAFANGGMLKGAEIADALTSDAKSVTDKDLTQGNTDNLAQYFYNLLAMVALYGALLGLNIAINNQANLSNLGMRRQCSPRHKSYTMFVSLCAAFVMQSICMVISVTFVRFVLGIDLGNRLGLVYLAAVIGGLLGVCLGFMSGSIGRAGFDRKNGVLMALIMFSCFLSGLMAGNMKAVMAKNMPWFNKVNPAAVISDSFYCLVIYDDLDRFAEKIITMLIMSAVFAVLGFALTRRRKYESL